MTWDRGAVEVAMRRAGLDPDAFDLDEIALDLETRTATSASLAASIGDGDGYEPPTVFDPRWAS